jgi:hypothetical protein
MPIRVVSIFVLTLLLSIAAFGGVVKEGSFSASSNGENIVLRWLSEQESGVVRYELERKAGVNGQFFLLVQIAPRGDNSSYDYVDDAAFRVTTETFYQYRIKVVFADGSSIYFGPISVSHSISSVRRTWGSIKAMFR